MKSETTLAAAARRLALLVLSIAIASTAEACAADATPSPEATSAAGQDIVVCSIGYERQCTQQLHCSSGLPPLCTVTTTCECVAPPPPFPLPFPQMPSGTGGIMPDLRLASVVFSGDQQFDGSLTQTDADTFGRFLVGSSWLQTVTASYRPNASTTPYDAAYLGTYVMPPFDGNPVDLPTLVANGLASGAIPPLPADTSDLLLEIYVPSAGCNTPSYRGESYHDTLTVDGVNVYFARICGNAAFYENNVGPSHEVAEAITDPNTEGYTFARLSSSSPWYVQGEICDACPMTTSETSPTYGTFSLATAWSNLAASAGGSPCVPAPASYENVSPSGPLPWNEWDTTPIPLKAGQATSLTLTAWTTQASSSNGVATGAWEVQAHSDPYTYVVPAKVTLSGTPGTLGVGDVLLAPNESTTLTVQAPAGEDGLMYVDVISTLSPGQESVWPVVFDVSL